jgi:hypothetical protein
MLFTKLLRVSRAQTFNNTNVTNFFDILEDVQKHHLYPPHRVYNVDETGLMTVQSKYSISCSLSTFLSWDLSILIMSKPPHGHFARPRRAKWPFGRVRVKNIYLKNLPR